MIKDSGSLDSGRVDKKFQACQSYFSFQRLLSHGSRTERNCDLSNAFDLPSEKVNVLDAHLGGGGLVHLEMTQLWHVALDSSST